MTLSFQKMAGAGNDFIVFDNRALKVSNLSKLAKRLCDRKNAVGADGIIALEKSAKADVRMRILNPDGSEAEMCGNGVRCLAKFAHERKITGSKLSVETIAGMITCEVRGDVVKAKMIDPKDLKLNLEIALNGHRETVGFVNTGVPHVVKFVKDLQKTDVQSLGKLIRNHPQFAPRGANANFISIGALSVLNIRTYERGVEGETLACGTGSTAAAMVAAVLKNLRSPVRVKTQSGETLKVYFSKVGTRFHDVYLEGKIQNTFEGRAPL